MRYLSTDEFVRVANDHKVTGNAAQLSYYREKRLLVPRAELHLPDDYLQWTKQAQWWPDDAPPADLWPGIARVLERQIKTDAVLAAVPDVEIQHPFDRTPMPNQYLVLNDRPQRRRLSPKAQSGTTLYYYGVWQLHLLHALNEDYDRPAPWFFEYDGQVKRRRHQPTVREIRKRPLFQSCHQFDGLSAYMDRDARERDRVFAAARLQGLDELTPNQQQALHARRARAAQLTLTTHQLTLDDLLTFLHQLVKLHGAYKEDERTLLARFTDWNIRGQEEFVHFASGLSRDQMATEIEARGGPSARRAFERLDYRNRSIADGKRTLLAYAGQFTEEVSRLTPTASFAPFTEVEADTFLSFCRMNGLSGIPYTLAAMMGGLDEEWKFHKETVYSTLQEAATSLEHFLKRLGELGKAPIKGHTTKPVLESALNTDMPVWNLISSNYKTLTWADTDQQLKDHFQDLRALPHLTSTLAGLIARDYMLTVLARNLTVHTYPSDEWFYTTFYRQTARAICASLLYTWRHAQSQGWV